MQVSAHELCLPIGYESQLHLTAADISSNDLQCEDFTSLALHSLECILMPLGFPRLTTATNFPSPLGRNVAYSSRPVCTCYRRCCKLARWGMIETRQIYKALNKKREGLPFGEVFIKVSEFTVKNAS